MVTSKRSNARHQISCTEINDFRQGRLIDFE